MQWDITVDKKVAFNVGYGAGYLFRKLKAFEMYWHAEGMKSLYSGTITANGEKYIVTNERSFGYADKNWGADFTSPWVWLSSCDLKSKLTGRQLQDSVFDIGGGRPKAFGIALNRKLLSDFWYEGKSYEFNFSVEDEKVAKRLERLGRKSLELHYNEYKHVLPWRGNSVYIVDSIVSIIDEDPDYGFEKKSTKKKRVRKIEEDDEQYLSDAEEEEEYDEVFKSLEYYEKK